MVILSKALRMQAQLRQLRHERDIYLSNAPELDLLARPDGTSTHDERRGE
jgi:hypothetical protein